MINIANSLGIGSGVDGAALARQLADAALAPREQALRTREGAVNARLSAIASTRSAIDTFADALGELFGSEGFAAIPASSTASVATVQRTAGARPAQAVMQLQVTQLARAESWRSATFTDVQAAIGTGGLTLTGPGGTASLTIEPANSTLGGLAAAINSAAVGVSARVIVDADGARLLLTGQMGAAGGFTLAPAGDASVQLAGTIAGMSQLQSGADALVNADTVPLRFADNRLSNLLPGVDITLSGLGETRIEVPPPSRGLGDVLAEFVTAYNDLRGALGRATASSGGDAGPLAGDSRVREVVRQLAQITTAPLGATGDGPQNLSDLGIRTGRDGKLSFDRARFDRVLAAEPERVRAMLDPAASAQNAPGLAGLMDQVRDRLNAEGGPLDTAADGYAVQRQRLTRERERMLESDDRLRARLSSQFAALDQRLTVLAASRSAIEQQIAAWQAGLER